MADRDRVRADANGPRHGQGMRLSHSQGNAVLEIKGRKDQIRQADVRQVVQWASDAKLAAGVEHKPLLIGNPHCETAPPSAANRWGRMERPTRKMVSASWATDRATEGPARAENAVSADSPETAD